MRFAEFLLERSEVIKKNGFSVLKAALTNEVDGNMQTGGAMACLLMSMSEMIRQQTGVSIDRLSLIQSLNTTNYTRDYEYQYEYQSFDKLVNKITTDGVFLYGKSDKVKFNLKMYQPSSISNIKKYIDDGISVIIGWENSDKLFDVQEMMDKTNYFRKTTAQFINDCKNLDDFISHAKDKRLNNEYSDFQMKELYQIARGIFPYYKNHDGTGSYHGVLLIGYDDSEKCFIIKDVRNKYLFDGLAKLPYQYVMDCINGKNKFIKAVLGIEAEKV